MPTCAQKIAFFPCFGVLSSVAITLFPGDVSRCFGRDVDWYAHIPPAAFSIGQSGAYRTLNLQEEDVDGIFEPCQLGARLLPVSCRCRCHGGYSMERCGSLPRALQSFWPEYNFGSKRCQINRHQIRRNAVNGDKKSPPRCIAASRTGRSTPSRGIPPKARHCGFGRYRTSG